MTPKPVLTSFEKNSWHSPEVTKIGLKYLSYDTSELTLTYDFIKLIESDVTDYLITLGYEVEALSTYKSMQTKALAISGGFYDAITGQRDSKKMLKYKQTLMADYIEKTGVELTLSLHFYKTLGKFTDNQVEWDSMQDLTTYPPAILFSNAKGTMPTISVNIEAVNIATGQRYIRTQGVQVNLGFHSEFDIHPDDMPLHLNNLRLGLQQLKQP